MARPALSRTEADNLRSLARDSTRALSLYVIQNEHGAIKIGRSGDPEERKTQIAQLFRCKVRLVAVFPDAGNKEEWCHRQLFEHALGSEWFAGHDVARARISELLASTFEWPYTESPATLEQWLARISDDATDRYWRKLERTAIRQLMGAVQGGHRLRPYLDSDIAFAMGHTNLMQNNEGLTGSVDGQGPRILLPAYTQSLEAARHLWPANDTSSPEPTTTDPLEFCLLALCERWGFDPHKLTPLGAP